MAGDAGETVGSDELTGTGDLLGTPRYMAPEIWRGERATQQSDVYSLGALLYELCTGHPPHTGPTVMALREVVHTRDVRPLRDALPTIAPGFAAAVDRCLRRDPTERFASGEDLCEALERREEPGRRRWGRRAMAGLVAAALLAGGTGSYFAASRINKPAAPTRPRRAVAILGFKNTSGRAGTAWLSMALSEGLRGMLAGGWELRIIPQANLLRMKKDLTPALRPQRSSRARRSRIPPSLEI